MNQIKTVIFDLDGTVYQNNHFHRDYIHFLLEGTDKASWEDIIVTYIDDVYIGKHLSMNCVYDSKEISAETPDEFFSALEQSMLQRCNEVNDKVTVDGIYLGDAWAVVTLIGTTLGLLRHDRANEIYKRTRNKMSLDGMSGNPRLRKAITKLNTKCKTVLLTNSYEETARDFISKLGFENVFETIVFSAGKPEHAVESVERYCTDLKIHPETFLAIGDNALNDLIPFHKLGCKTVWVNPFLNICEPVYDYSVKSLDELSELIELMCATSDCLM